jgi:hypothetical protein
MTVALAVCGVSIVKILTQHEHPQDNTDKGVNDVFHVAKRDSGSAHDDEELAEGLLDWTRTPMNVNSVNATISELETIVTDWGDNHPKWGVMIILCLFALCTVFSKDIF